VVRQILLDPTEASSLHRARQLEGHRAGEESFITIIIDKVTWVGSYPPLDSHLRLRKSAPYR
jgi:hypothetical protein